MTFDDDLTVMVNDASPYLGPFNTTWSELAQTMKFCKEIQDNNFQLVQLTTIHWNIERDGSKNKTFFVHLALLFYLFSQTMTDRHRQMDTKIDRQMDTQLTDRQTDTYKGRHKATVFI